MPNAVLRVLQVAQAIAAPDNLSNHITQLLLTVALLFQTWIINTVQETRKIVRSIEQAVFGRSGDNGMEATVTKHTTELSGVQMHLGRHDSELKRLDEERRHGPPDRRSHP